MDVILHIGAHRTGTTTFQSYLRDYSDMLTASGVIVWDPRRTRNGLFRGLMDRSPQKPGKRSPQDRAVGRVKLRLEQARQQGTQAVLVSDENMIGSVRECLRAKRLYPAIGERMARFARAFDGRITRVVLCVRAPDRFWASAMAYGVARGHPVPKAKDIDALTQSARGWRDVITDLACAVPDTEIRVIPFESHYAHPGTLMRTAIGLDVAVSSGDRWLNRAPDLSALRDMLRDRGQSTAHLPTQDGRWEPFNENQAAAMRETYADDLHWLAQGADGLAQLTEEAMPRGRGKARPEGDTRGQDNDQEGRLGQAG